MKCLSWGSSRGQEGDSRTQMLWNLWTVAGLTALGVLLGYAALYLTAGSYGALSSGELLEHYMGSPLLLYLNCLPGVLLVWFFYFSFGRGWLAYLFAAIPVIGIALVNYYKIQFRGDPFLASDLRLATEAGDMMGHYTLEFSPVVQRTLLMVLVGLVLALVLRPRRLRVWKLRLFGLVSAAAILMTAQMALYCNEELYLRTEADEDWINLWSDTEVYLARGSVYSFLYSVQNLFPKPPEAYDPATAQAILEEYTEMDIPQEKQVNVVGIMLEAFCDLTDFPVLAEKETVQAVYEPLHALEEQSVSGDLITNIFAGGTVDTEWAFLTGFSQHEEFDRPTDSYVWYFDRQGYLTRGSHPGYGWFYNRETVNEYLGFQEYWFTENHYGELVDPVGAVWNSDSILMEEIVRDLQEQLEIGEQPVFSFSVSYQNHGPYEAGWTSNEVYLDPEITGLSEQTCNIFNNYLHGINMTITAITNMVQQLEEMEDPVVLVLFGDHKPWGGNDNSAYAEIESNFDLSTLDGMYRYYATPYLIWANSAAKETLDQDFQGDGGDFSPCFLMNELFEQCGWTGPAFLQYAEEIRQLTPLVHARNLYLDAQGTLTDVLPEGIQRRLLEYQWVQYYREFEVVPFGGELDESPG